MIAKAKSITHGGKASDYVLKKEGAEIIDKRLIVGDTGNEIKEEFRMFQDLNSRCANNDLTFVISPEPKDGRKLTNSDFKAISEEFLKKMNLDKHQALVVKHTDKEHTHVHIIVNRINEEGKAYNDSFISKQSQTIADKIAQDRGLTRASVVQEFNKTMDKDIKATILQKHNAALWHNPVDFNQYKELMQSNGVNVIPSINNSGKLQGYRVEFEGRNLKASEVHRSMSLSTMGVKGASLDHNPKLAQQRQRTINKQYSR